MTIKDIARLAGCGISTVSRALNDHPDISAETKQKIKAIVEKYNYTPNANARSLKQGVGKSILLIVKGSTNAFLSVIAEQIQLCADRFATQVSVCYLGEQENEVRTAERLCREQKPLGVIFLGGDLQNFKNDFSSISVPCVLSTASAKSLGLHRLSSVSVDDFDAGKRSVDYLFEMGHTNIGIISGDVKTPNPSQLRFCGALKSFEEHNAELVGTMHEKASYTFSSAYEATTALMHRCPHTTAIFAMSDIMAMGAVRALFDMEISVPSGVSVIGFDGIEMSQYTVPRITGMAQPSEQIASLSVKLLEDMIENGAESSHIQLKAVLRAGESVSFAYK